MNFHVLAVQAALPGVPTKKQTGCPHVDFGLGNHTNSVPSLGEVYHWQFLLGPSGITESQHDQRIQRKMLLSGVVQRVNQIHKPNTAASIVAPSYDAQGSLAGKRWSSEFPKLPTTQQH